MASETKRTGAVLLRLLTADGGGAPGIPPTGQLLAYVEKIGPETQLYTISPEGITRTWASLPTIAFTTGEAVDVGELVAVINSAGSTRLVKADANGGTTRETAAGFCTVGAALGGTANITNFGQVVIPDAEWDIVPTITEIGDPVFMSTTPGNVTLTAPASGTVQRVGIVSLVGGGSTSVLVQIGQPIRE